MSDDYLWNRTGDPDPETARLEELLGKLKYAGPPESAAVMPTRRRRLGWWLAAAASIAAISAAAWLMRGAATDWRTADGTALRAGQTIETGAAKAELQSPKTGEVTVEPGSQLRLVQANAREQRFDLRVGAIHAFIWAPPGNFVVDTPSSKAVDLGCRYTLRVSKDGTGLLTVDFGWVAFERNHVESFIPAGAACVTRPGKGPGTPYFEDASPRLIDALSKFDSSGGEAALEAAISSATPHDALSLWHLMTRTHGELRGKVFDRFAALVKLPDQATRSAILRGNGEAIDAAWNALNLGDTSWWREWKRQW